MRKILFSISLLLLTVSIYTGCQEGITDSQNTINNKNVGGYEVVLVGGSPKDNGDETYTWIWSITKTTAKKNLSHWSFEPGICLQPEEIISAGYWYGTTGVYTPITPIPSFADDPSMDCDDPDIPVFKFNYGASGTTFYQLVLNKNYQVDTNAIMYFKFGNDCGKSTFDGIGCPSQCDEWIVYGSQYGSQDQLFKVDLKNKTSNMIYNPGEISSYLNYPNGNAFDPDNNRIYFGTNDGRLYYHQLESGTHVLVTTGLGNLASACWYNGKYYYIKNGTNQLWAVNGTTKYYIGTVPTLNGYGDIVFDPENPGWFIGSAGAGTTTSNEVVWYLYNVTTKENHILTKLGGPGINTVGGLCHKQLAFGSNGILYALDTGNNTNTGSVEGRFYTVTIDYEEFTYELSSYWDSGLALTDLASGPRCQ